MDEFKEASGDKVKSLPNNFTQKQSETNKSEQGEVTPSLTLRRFTVGSFFYVWGGYVLYCLYHIVALPVVLARFIGRIAGGRYKGVILQRFLGGSKSPGKEDWTLIVSSGLGETRTAIQAAEEIQRESHSKVAVLTQLPRLPGGMRPEDADFPLGFAPFNSPVSAIFCILRWRPKAILFVEFSGNYHLAFAAKFLGIRTAIINVNLPEHRLRRLQKKLLGKWQFSFLDCFCCQSQTHAERLIRLGVSCHQIVVVGIGLPKHLTSILDRNRMREKWRKNLQLREELTIVAGSTYPEEERVLLNAVETLRIRLQREVVLVLAPRHLDRNGGAASVLNELNIDYEIRSMLDRHKRVANTVLLDSIGELSQVYSAADVIFIGGTWVTGVGGHNPLEAYQWGVPITVGPHFGQQEATVTFCEQKGLLQICASQTALIEQWYEWLSDASNLEAMNQRFDEGAADASVPFYESFQAVYNAK